MKHSLTALCTIALLASCSSVPETDFYTPGQANGQLEVPPDLTGIIQSDRYIIPAGSGAVRASQLNHPQKQDDIKNQQVLPKSDNMHIEREGSVRWLVVNDKNPQEVWPQLKAFWQENGFVIDQENPITGFMQTQWAENRTAIPSDPVRKLLQKVGLGSVYSSAFRDRFLIRVERAQNSGTAITFSHQGVEEQLTGSKKDTARWINRPNDPNLEAQFLARFMMRLGGDQKTVEHQLEQSAPAISQLAKIEGDSLLLMGESARNRYRLKMALSRVGLIVQDFDDVQNQFTVQTALEEKGSEGWFFGLFGKKEAPEPQRLKIGIQSESDGVDRVRLYDLSGRQYAKSNRDDILNALWRELH